MTRNFDNVELDALRPFDAAPSSLVNQTTTIRAEARLEQILATRPNQARAPQLVPARRQARSKSWALRWAAIPVTAALAFAAGILLPDGAGVAPAHASLATWQRVPNAIPPFLLNTADERCQHDLTIRNVSTQLLNGVMARDLDFSIENHLIASEERGDWGFLVYADQHETTLSTCLVWLNAAGGPEVQSIQALGVGSRTGISFGTGERSQIESSSAAGFFSDDRASIISWDILNDGGLLTSIVSQVDPEITELVLHTNEGDVTATLQSGWYVAWWPGTADDVPGSEGGGFTANVGGTAGMMQFTGQALVDQEDWSIIVPGSIEGFTVTRNTATGSETQTFNRVIDNPASVRFVPAN